MPPQEHVEMDVDRIIDTNNNEFVLSSPKGAGSMALRLDPIFIRDLTVIIAAASVRARPPWADPSLCENRSVRQPWRLRNVET